MKKILFLLPSLGVGGLERMQVTLANALVKKDYDVTVMILDSSDDLKGDLDKRVRLIHKPYKKHLGQKIPFIRHKFYDDGMWETRATPEQLYRYYIGDEKYDVEVAFFRGMPIKIISGGVRKSCIFLKRKETSLKQKWTDSNQNDMHEDSSVRRIAWVHSDFRRISGFANNFKSMNDVHRAYSSFDKVVCVSNEAQNSFREVVGDTGNLTTIYNLLPVDEIRAKAQETPSLQVRKAKFHLVLVGRLLDTAKGQNRLIDVVVRLHDKGKDISLALVGGGVDEQKIRDKIIEKHAQDYITMCGSQVNPYPFIRESDLLVCSSYFEGYNLTVAEALILGVPVLSTNCTGPNEILDHGKFGLIVENSEEGLYCGLKEVADKPEMLSWMREKAIERQKFFDENRQLEEIMNLFEEEWSGCLKSV